MTECFLSLPELKSQAKRLRTVLAEQGAYHTHSECLELLARQNGFRDWNTLVARIGNLPPILQLRPGDRVRGSYLGHPFDGEVLGVQTFSEALRVQATVQFDDPIDVIQFDSFSSYRRRVTASLNAAGRTNEKTSDGEPHMRILAINQK